MSEDTNTQWVTCSRCGGKRNCKTQAQFDEKGGDRDYSWQQEWRIFQCCGCNYTFVHRTGTNSEDYYDDDDGETHANETYTFWPALAKRKRPDWVSDWGIEAEKTEKLDDVILEVYTALDNDLLVLSAIGLRTCFDVASELLGADSDLSFANKLKELVSKNHIRETDTERLHLLIDSGNASAHRGWKPNAKELGTITEILEHFIYDSFVAPYRKSQLDPKALKIKQGVPARKKK